MITDTSAEALRKKIKKWRSRANKAFINDEDDYATGFQVCANELAKILQVHAAEKRRAREGVTDEVVERAAIALAEWDGQDPNRLIWEGNPPEPWGEVRHKYEDQARAALEAVWPDGRDAKDAARYRWLRSCGAAAEELAICTDYGWVTGSDFDETIDAAMAQESGR